MCSALHLRYSSLSLSKWEWSWHCLQTLLSGSASKTLPESIDITITQPFCEEYPRFCHVPSHEMPQFTISSSRACWASLMSFAAFDIEFLAITLTCLAIVLAFFWYALAVGGGGMFINVQNFLAPLCPFPMDLMEYTKRLFISKLKVCFLDVQNTCFQPQFLQKTRRLEAHPFLSRWFSESTKVKCAHWAQLIEENAVLSSSMSTNLKPVIVASSWEGSSSLNSLDSGNSGFGKSFFEDTDFLVCSPRVFEPCASSFGSSLWEPFEGFVNWFPENFLFGRFVVRNLGGIIRFDVKRDENRKNISKRVFPNLRDFSIERRVCWKWNFSPFAGSSFRYTTIGAMYDITESPLTSCRRKQRFGRCFFAVNRK